MKIPTTITAIKDNVCLFETDVVCHIDWHVDRRYGELEWHVDQYVAEEDRRVWDDMAQTWKTQRISVAVPKKLAEVFDDYLDKTWMEEQIREQLADYGDDRGDYIRDQMMDR